MQNPEIPTNPTEIKSLVDVPVKFEMVLVKVGDSLRMTIPKPICAGMNLKAGTVMVIVADGNALTVTKKAEG